MLRKFKNLITLEFGSKRPFKKYVTVGRGGGKVVTRSLNDITGSFFKNVT
jgi:hypothetical protein